MNDQLMTIAFTNSLFKWPPPPPRSVISIIVSLSLNIQLVFARQCRHPPIRKPVVQCWLSGVLNPLPLHPPPPICRCFVFNLRIKHHPPNCQQSVEIFWNRNRSIIEPSCCYSTITTHIAMGERVLKVRSTGDKSIRCANILNSGRINYNWGREQFAIMQPKSFFAIIDGNHLNNWYSESHSPWNPIQERYYDFTI